MPLNFGSQLDIVRNNLYLRILHGLQLFFAIVILGVSASNASDWHSLGCSVPGKLGYNIAAAIITILPLLYVVAATGKQHVSALPWHHFGQLGLDGFLFLIWIASTATASLNCSDVCKACSKSGSYYDDGCGFEVYSSGLYCPCTFTGYDYCPFDKHKRAVLEARDVFEKRASTSRAAFRGVSNASKQGINVVELVLFFFSLAATGYLMFEARKNTHSTATHGTGPAAPPQQPPTEPKVDPSQPANPPPSGTANDYYQQQSAPPVYNAPQGAPYQQAQQQSVYTQQPSQQPTYNAPQTAPYEPQLQQTQPTYYPPPDTHHAQHHTPSPATGGHKVELDGGHSVSPVDTSTNTSYY